MGGNEPPTLEGLRKASAERRKLHRLRLLPANRDGQQPVLPLTRISVAFAHYQTVMCNLYSMTRNVEAIRRLFRISHNRAPASIEPIPAIFPGHMAPVVRRAADGERELTMLSWGFVLLQNGKAPRRVTNVRDDKVLTSRFWRDSFEQRRCFLPASSFCEPFSDVKPATWHWFALRGDEPRPLFAFPGIWKRWRGPLKKDGPKVDVEVYAFMTTEPNSLVSTINHERMPVLLTEEAEFQTWLTGSPEEAFGLVCSFDPARMQIVQSGMEKQDRATTS